METTSKTCISCNSNFDAAVLKFGDKVVYDQVKCDNCLDQDSKAYNREQEKILRKRRYNEFYAFVPPIYQDTDKERLSPILAMAMETWEYGPQGLGFIGTSGAGKTRSAVRILERMHMTGKSVCFLKATKLTRYAIERFHDDHQVKNIAAGEIRRAYSSDVVLLDDLGKGRMSPTAEELLFDIIDHRTERKKPILWTSNCTDQQLHSMLSVDRADAILRRLSEFTKVISL